MDTVLGLYYGSAVITHQYLNGDNEEMISFYLISDDSFDVIRYPATTKNYTAFYASGGRDPLLNNNALTYFNISTIVTVNKYVTNTRGASVLNTRYAL